MTTFNDSKFYLSCGILAKWHSKTFDQFVNDKEALRKVREYVKEHKKFKENGVGLFLWGANGTGKSHLVNCAFKELLNYRYKVRIVSFSALITNYIRGWSESGEESVIRDLKRADFLCIEELGKEFKSKESELAKTVLDTVLRYRVQMNKPTWFTFNGKPSEIDTLYSVDIASMLKECCITLQVTGIDYRDEIRTKLKKEL